MTEELVKKLRYESTWRDDYPEDKDMLLQAADVIEQLDKDLERAKEWASFWEKEANEALKKFQVAVASKPRWLPVTGRLPEDFKKVLVFWQEHSEPMIDTAFWMEDSKSFNCSHWERAGEKVTHWMPLPDPPKGDKG